MPGSNNPWAHNQPQFEFTAKTTVGPMEISDSCLQSMPCQHYIYLDGVAQSGPWGARKIVKYLQEHDLPIPPHFTYCLALLERERVNDLIKADDADVETFKALKIRHADYLHVAVWHKKHSFIQFILGTSAATSSLDRNCMDACTRDVDVFKLVESLADFTASQYSQLFKYAVKNETDVLVEYLTQMRDGVYPDSDDVHGALHKPTTLVVLHDLIKKRAEPVGCNNLRQWQDFLNNDATRELIEGNLIVLKY